MASPIPLRFQRFFSQTDQLLNTEMVLARLGFTIIKNSKT